MACLLLTLLTFLGCGGRTETLFNEQGAAGAPTGSGGAVGVAGFGSAGLSGGAPSAGGASGSAEAGFGVGGAIGSAGAPVAGGAPSVGGSTGGAGAPGAGGFQGVAGAVGGPIVDACVAVAGNSCQKCLCNVCSAQVVGCFSNAGCALIFACVDKTGCQGLGCYTNGTCRPVIDQFGGLSGSALGSVFSLAACSVSSQAACVCN